MRLNQVTVEVSDIGRARAFYQALGLTLIVSSDHYARFVCGPDEEASSTFSVHLADPVHPARGGVYFEFDDVDAQVETLKARGLKFEIEPVDQVWLWREAWLSDPDGNRICLFHAASHRINPPWRVGKD